MESNNGDSVFDGVPFEAVRPYVKRLEVQDRVGRRPSFGLFCLDGYRFGWDS